MLSPRRFWIGIVLLHFEQAIAQYNRPCYWYNGTSTDDTDNPYGACYADGDSHCCLVGEACVSNGLCFGGGLGEIYRGACTDSTWSNSAACPAYCHGHEDSTSVNRWANLNHVFGGDMTCAGTDVSYPYPSGDVLLVVNTTGSASHAPATATQTAATTITAQASSTSTSSSQHNGMVSTSVPIGVGVGIGVALGAATIALGILYMRERRLRKAVERDLNARGAASGGYNNWDQNMHFSQDQKMGVQRNPGELYNGRDRHELG